MLRSFARTRIALHLVTALLALSCCAVADAGLDTETYINAIDGFGEINGDRTGLGLVTLEDQRGGDLWNTGDTFIYLHDDDQIRSDFTAMVRVVSQTASVDGRWGKAGLHARANLSPFSQNAMTQLATGNGSQADTPASGAGHNPVPARIAGRAATGGFEIPIIRNPDSGLRPHSGNQVANDFFQTTDTLPSPASPKVWLRLDYTASSNRFVSGIAIDNDGRPGPWSFSQGVTDVPSDGDGWYVGLGYSVHSDFDIPPNALHGITFDNYAILTPGNGRTGDFNFDGEFDCLDIDALSRELASGGNTVTFDLNEDGTVDSADLSQWLADAGQATLSGGGAILPGDANLDGVVDVSDFNTWNQSKFLSGEGWCSGDFNVDGSVDVSDFNIWNANKFSASGLAVPEPTTPYWWVTVVCCLVTLESRRFTRNRCI